MSSGNIKSELRKKGVDRIFWGEIHRIYNFCRFEGTPKTVEECIKYVYQKHVEKAKERGEDDSLSNLIRLAKEDLIKRIQISNIRLERSKEDIQRNRETRNKIIKMTEKLGVPRNLRADVVREYNMARFNRQPISMEEAYKIIKEKK